MFSHTVKLFAAIVCLAAVEAEAATGSKWVYGTGEFRRDAQGSWVEYQNGAPVFEFVETARNADLVLLFDSSRGINVKLLGSQAVVTSGASTLLTLNGGWSWQEWSSDDGRGTIVHTGNGTWQEYLNGNPTFTFRETARGPNVVHLYDASRGITVKLSADKNVVMSGADTLLVVPGGWSD